MAKIYELTTNVMDGFRKMYVAGLKSDKDAKRLAKKGYGKYYWDRGISYYDTTESAKARVTFVSKYWMSESQFIKYVRAIGYK